MSTRSGYFLVFRNVWKHKSFRSLIEASVWLYMISSASHKDKTLSFLDNKIFVKRGELIFPLRKNATFWKMTYSEMRSFILRLKRRGMVTTRLAQLIPTSDHPRRNITIISVVNYDKFQYVDNEQPPQDQLSPLTNTLDTNTNILNYRSSKNKIVKSGDKVIGTEGAYNIILVDGKKYLKHKYKDEPIKEY